MCLCWSSGNHTHQSGDAHSSCRLTEQCYTVRVSTKGLDVLLNPVQSRYLVQQPPVSAGLAVARARHTRFMVSVSKFDRQDSESCHGSPSKASLDSLVREYPESSQLELLPSSLDPVHGPRPFPPVPHFLSLWQVGEGPAPGPRPT